MNILLTSAGRRSYIVKYFIEALNGDGYVHASNSSWSPALQVADRSVITPLIYDSTYIEFLLKYSIQNNISAIIPLFDIDLPVLSKNIRRFKKNNIEIIVSDNKTTNICNDKWETYIFFKKNGFFTPKTFLSIKDVISALNGKAISFPLILKPRWGMGSLCIYSVRNVSELKILYYKAKKDIESSYLKYESESDYEHSIIIQEQLIGQEYGLDIINNLNRQYVTTFVKRKISMRSGETDRAITENNEILRSLGQNISLKIKHIALLDVDCFMVKEKPYLLEMNCRFGGGYPFSHMAGANIPLAIINWLKGKKAPLEILKVRDRIEAMKDIQPILLEHQ